MQLKKMQSNIYRQYALLKKGLAQRSNVKETADCQKSPTLPTSTADNHERLKRVIKWQAKGH